MMLYLRLFYEFAKTGLFAVGGGMATIPFLLDMGTRTGWFTEQDVADMFAVSESTPGPMGVNMATYIGYRTGGVFGSLIATLGLILPSIIIILIVAAFLQKFRTNKTVDAVFQGIRPASLGLIGAAMLRVWRLTFLPKAAEATLEGGIFGWLRAAIDLRVLVLAVFLFFLIRKTKFHPTAYIGIAAAIGILVFPLL